MATSTAETTTLSTPELLELIPLNLDIQTLLLSQRICRTWQEIIQESLPLQKHLFLAPIDDSPTVQKSHNSLLVKKFPTFFNTTYEYIRDG
jgi:hypothetical protein